MCVSKDTVYALLLQCARHRDLHSGRHLHSQIVSSGIDLVPALGDQLIRLFGSSGSLLEANVTFCSIRNPNIFSWHAIISAHELHGESKRAIQLYHSMHREGIVPDKFVFTSALRACGSTGDLDEGKVMHDQTIRSSLDAENAVANSLVYMYAKCKCLKEAFKVFCKSPNPDIVAWSTIITGYAEQHRDSIALELFLKMQRQGIEPDRVMFLCILKLCGNIGAMSLGKVVHNQIISSGLKSDISVGNALTDMYAKCGNMEEAQKAFEHLPYRDAVSWTTLILGFTEQGMGFSAVEFFEKMLDEDLMVDRVTLLCVLKACTSIGAVKKGRSIHDQIIVRALESDLAIGSTIVDMYARCGDLDGAHRILNRLANRNVVSWNAMIAGYADHADYNMVLQCLENMQTEGMQPSTSTFSTILAACSHAGQVKDGYFHFVSMRRKYGIIPNSEHYLCMIDLLSRSGRLLEAKRLLQTMPDIKDYTGWMSLLTACRKYGNVEIGQQCFDHISQVDPSDGSCYMLMSNIYFDAQLWEELDRMHADKSFAQAWKKPGQAWIEIKSKVYEFFVGEVAEPQMNAKLSRLKVFMKSEGYVGYSNVMVESL